MLDLNQRPPPCKGEVIVSQTFVIVQIFLQTDVFSLLNRSYCSPLFVWVGVLLVYLMCAATSVAQRLGLPRRMVTILEGESLIHDATAIGNVLGRRYFVLCRYTSKGIPWAHIARLRQHDVHLTGARSHRQHHLPLR